MSRESRSSEASARPYFLWDVDVDEDTLRERLRSDDPDARAQWAGWVMAEARYDDVWKYLTLEDIVRDWSLIRRHLGRMRRFWEFLLEGWRADGLLQ